jgi:hypothetical protein
MDSAPRPPEVKIFRLYTDEGNNRLRAGVDRFTVVTAYETEHAGTMVIRAVDVTWGDPR